MCGGQRVRVYCECADLAYTPNRTDATQTMLMDMYLRLRWYFLDVYHVRLLLALALDRLALMASKMFRHICKR